MKDMLGGALLYLGIGAVWAVWLAGVVALGIPMTIGAGGPILAFFVWGFFWTQRNY